MKRMVAIGAAAAGLLLVLTATAQVSPYAGQQGRAIKALPEQQVKGLLAGEGLGFAKSAELNSYPGPRHVLDLAAELGLDADRRRRIDGIFFRMNAQARDLGRAIVEREAALDRLFADRQIDDRALAALTAEIGDLEGRLRAVHLRAHLETTALLSGAEVARYDVLRGYAGAETKGGGVKAPPGGHGGHRH